ncbi:hypothetical protein BCR44DRAFT_1176252 [Catenaria anguillulae PL171]|uniref:Uncharacterized protein n=1 Tax=Catenaria anguillulae PL171 TaxID=765915 RepID=A0A1Y2I4V5_9FUNG|nr:hypothetical protein BCR44DRAFT_1176252 [Catenaria anguillulae PL171]
MSKVVGCWLRNWLSLVLFLSCSTFVARATDQSLIRPTRKHSLQGASGTGHSDISSLSVSPSVNPSRYNDG